jgi:hypothetical protein
LAKKEGRKTMNKFNSEVECVFIHNQKCDFTNNECSACNDRVKIIEGLDYKDHYLIYEKRKQNNLEIKFKYSTIIISICAIVISIFSLIMKNEKINKIYFYIKPNIIQELKNDKASIKVIEHFDKICDIKCNDAISLYNFIKIEIDDSTIIKYNSLIFKNLSTTE